MRDAIEPILVVVALYFVFWCGMTYQQATQISSCEEDAVLIGYGNFENGRFERYKCGPSVDDYVVMPL